MRKAALAAAILAAAAVAFLVWPGRDGGRAAPPEAAGPAAEEARPGGALVRVRVEAPDGTPRPGVPVVLLVEDRAEPGLRFPLPEKQASGPDGGAVLRIPPEVLEKWRRKGIRAQAYVAAELRDGQTEPLPVETGTDEVYRIVVPHHAPVTASALRVLVADAAGAPAVGVLVHLLARRRDGGEAWRVARVESDRAGVAEFAAATITDTLRGAGRMQVALDFLVECGIPGSRIPVPPEALEGQPLRVALPAAGTVTVVAGADGEAFLSWASGSVVQRPLAGGTARFDHVGLGLELRVGARLKDPALRAEGRTVAGPRVPGEAITVELAVGVGRQRALLARIVDAQGRSVATTWAVEVASSRECYVQPDASGRVTIPVWGTLPPDGCALRVREAPPPEGAPRTGSLDLPRLPDLGETLDVGEIVVDSGPSGSVAGQVVDAAGEPVAGATVSVRVADARSETTTGRDGRFVLDGLPLGQAVTVWAGRHGFLGAEAAGVPLGTTDLRLVLVQAGKVVGSVRTDADIALDRIEVLLAGCSLALGRAQAPGPGGVFVFEPLPAGEATLAVQIHGTSWRLVTGVAATVVAGRSTAVDPIDLRGRLRNLHALVRKDDGEPLRSARVRITDDAGDGATHLRTDAEGVVRTLVPAEPARLGLEADGFLRASFANAGEAAIVLRRP